MKKYKKSPAKGLKEKMKGPSKSRKGGKSMPMMKGTMPAMGGGNRADADLGKLLGS